MSLCHSAVVTSVSLSVLEMLYPFLFAGVFRRDGSQVPGPVLQEQLDRSTSLWSPVPMNTADESAGRVLGHIMKSQGQRFGLETCSTALVSSEVSHRPG